VITAFLPCRSGSQRIKNKNLKRFSNFKNGLLEIKISQLLRVKEINKIIVSTDDNKIINYLKTKTNKKIFVIKREKNLSSSHTKTDDLIKYVPSIINNGLVMWTHVTSPFINSIHYTKAIEIFKKNKKRYDSLVSVTKLQDFIFINKKLYKENKYYNWPNTQNLSPIFLCNNGIFLTDVKSYIKYGDRLGKKIFFYECDYLSSIDIDWPEDFFLAKKLYEKNIKKI
jgi:CMP-N-acetylneuraminic acid synthetase